MTSMFKGRSQRIHFGGIGGIGMSGIAEERRRAAAARAAATNKDQTCTQSPGRQPRAQGPSRIWSETR